MKSHPAVWFDICVQKLDRARKFHESGFSIGHCGSISLALDAEGYMFGLHSNR